ncbi:MAG: hypothetical protein WKG01_21790 [Kofleriaceae bacterium]
MRALLVLALAACGGSGTPTKTSVTAPKLQRRGQCPLERADGAYHIETTQKALRRGERDTKFSATPTTPTTPIQLCGLRSELEWLTRVTCDDGSRPWGNDLDRAHGARQGSHVPEITDPCTKPTNLYIAPCKEREYWIYLDIYHCAPDEQLYRDVKLSEQPAS